MPGVHYKNIYFCLHCFQFMRDLFPEWKACSKPVEVECVICCREIHKLSVGKVS